MFITGYDGKIVDAKLEVVEQRIGPVVTMSTIREPTEDEVRVLQSKKCDHVHQDMLLVVDESGFCMTFEVASFVEKALVLFNKHLTSEFILYEPLK